MARDAQRTADSIEAESTDGEGDGPTRRSVLALLGVSGTFSGGAILQASRPWYCAFIPNYPTCRTDDDDGGDEACDDELDPDASHDHDETEVDAEADATVTLTVEAEHLGCAGDEADWSAFATTAGGALLDEWYGTIEVVD